MSVDVRVIIPAFNEENAVGKVIKDIPSHMVKEVIVVDNNSSDRTKQKAKEAGAMILEESFQGYGASCLRGMHYIQEDDLNTDIVVFLDADYSDYPEQMNDLIQPIVDNEADLVVGSRALGKRQKNSMTLPQRFGNWLATRLIRIFYKHTYTDLGPFRAIRYSSLLQLNMEDRTYGWTVEMQIKGIKEGLRCIEVPVNYRERVGVSKISGTVKGVVLAGYTIIKTIVKLK